MTTNSAPAGKLTDGFHLVVDARVDILGGDGDAIFALQAFVQRFDGLHCLGQILAQNLVSMNPGHMAEFPYPGLHKGTGAGEGTRTPTSCDTGT